MLIEIIDTSDRIHTARRAAGLNQKQLAKKLGIGSKRLSHYELGLRAMPLTIVAQIASALNVSFIELFGAVDTDAA